MQKLRERGIGVLVILHNLNLALSYADQVLVMHHGQVAAHGAPTEVLTDALLSEVYGLPVRVMKSMGGAPLTLAGTQVA
ncbi:MAG: hypothetical protein ACREVM_01830 [Burkholderiales bacterium]